MENFSAQPVTLSLAQWVAGRIAKEFQPKKIILFGSLAEGRADEEADIDLFVVMPSSLRRDMRAQQIADLFADRLFPLDLLVYTPEEVQRSLSRGNFFIKEILEKGKPLYDA